MPVRYKYPNYAEVVIVDAENYNLEYAPELIGTNRWYALGKFYDPKIEAERVMMTFPMNFNTGGIENLPFYIDYFTTGDATSSSRRFNSTSITGGEATLLEYIVFSNGNNYSFFRQGQELINFTVPNEGEIPTGFTSYGNNEIYETVNNVRVVLDYSHKAPFQSKVWNATPDDRGSNFELFGVYPANGALIDYWILTLFDANGSVIGSIKNNVEPEYVIIFSEEEQCPPDTCPVDCGTYICCYNSQGISTHAYYK